MFAIQGKYNFFVSVKASTTLLTEQTNLTVNCFTAKDQ